ncbi:MAG: site-2 protease family protein [Candidatus Micrarchaeia archaeon]
MNRKTIISTLIYVADAALFFAIVLSGIPDLWKVVLALATVAAGGKLLADVHGWKSYFGINIIRGGWGLKAMGKFASKHPKLARFVADVGAGIGYGMIYSIITFGKKHERVKLAVMLLLSLAFSLLLSAGSFSSQSDLLSNTQFLAILACGVAGGLALQSLAVLVISAMNILTIPNAPAGAQLLIVGVTVPWEWVFGLVIAATIHEFAHGILCRVEKLRVLGSGTILWGFLPLGAFVEPDEERFKHIALEKKRRILAAGPAANLLAFIGFTLLSLGFAAVAGPAYSDMSAVKVLSVNSTAYPGSSQLAAGDIITAVDGERVVGISGLASAISDSRQGDTLVLSTQDGDKTVTVGNRNKLGISVLPAATAGNEIVFAIIGFIMTVLASTAYINVAIGAINLVPLFITDGARIVSEELNEGLTRMLGKKRGLPVAARLSLLASVAAVLLIAVNLALPTVLRALAA